MNYDTTAVYTLISLLIAVWSLTVLFNIRLLILAYDWTDWQHGILVHYTTAQEIKRLKKETTKLIGQINYWHQVQVEEESTGQLRFELPEEPIKDVVIEYEVAGQNGDQVMYHQIWKMKDWLKKVSNNYRWIEREYRNRRNATRYQYMWVEEDQFDSKKDIDVLQIQPVLDYEYIYPDSQCLPYTWHYIGVTDHETV